MPRHHIERALRLLPPLEARVMREVWSGNVPTPFIGWDVHVRMPELAYSTVMTTVVRLTSKGMLRSRRVPGQRSVSYQAAGSAAEFLRQSSRARVDELVRQYGEAAFVAFADSLCRLAPEQGRRLSRTSPNGVSPMPESPRSR